MTTYRLHPAGPHNDDYTRHIADTFAESVLTLTYATRDPDTGITEPATLNSVLAKLRTGMQYMDQLLRQLDMHLDYYDRDDLADSATGNPALSLGTARLSLDDARQTAADLASHLDEAFNATSGLYLAGPEQPARPSVRGGEPIGTEAEALYREEKRT